MAVCVGGGVKLLKHKGLTEDSNLGGPGAWGWLGTLLHSESLKSRDCVCVRSGPHPTVRHGVYALCFA